MSTLSCTCGLVKWMFRRVKAAAQAQPVRDPFLAGAYVQLSPGADDTRQDGRLRLDDEVEKVLNPALGNIDVQVR